MLTKLQKYVDEMRESTSVNAKKSILEKYASDEDIKKLLRYTYDPYLKYGVTKKNILKKADLSEDWKLNIGGVGWNPARTLFDLLDDLAARKLTGHDAIRAVYAYIYSAGESHKDLILSIINKDLQTRANATLINKVIPKLIPTFDVALANTLESVNPNKVNVFDGNWSVSRKLDGVRCICITDENGLATFYTREGNKINTVNKLKEVVDIHHLPNIVFDGELCLIDEAGNEDFQGIVSAFRKGNYEIPNPAYNIFDYLTKEEFNTGCSAEDRDYNTRYRELSGLFHSKMLAAGGQLRQVLQTTLRGPEQLEACKEQAAELGWEGLMLRKSAPYKAGRTNDLLKVKSFIDAEFEVIGMELGEFRSVANGKEVLLEDVLSNILIGLVVDGTTYSVGVGSGFSLEERVRYAKNPELIVGKRVTVKYFGVTQNKEGSFSLRIPTFKCIRDFE